MAKKVKFTYFLNGKKVNKFEINWDANIDIKTIDNIVYVSVKNDGFLATRHKKPPTKLNK